MKSQSDQGYIHNKRELFRFRFNKVFGQDSAQDTIFDAVARPVTDSVLQGYNGTIFAYGQTGSGKTYTITGGAERFADRGIIPRTLSYLYEAYSEDLDREYTTQVSYLEIYNDAGFDLLNPKHDVTRMEDLPRVTLQDIGGNVHLKNLSVHTVATEEDALNALFLGDTNRYVSSC